MRASPGIMDSDESFSHRRTDLAPAQVLHNDVRDEYRVPKQPSIITKSITSMT
jgi:hypothetical protein